MGSIMKANEFSPKRKSPPTPSIDPATTEVVAEQSPVIQEKKLVKKVKAAVPADAAMYGIDDPNGPEVRRLREHHPEVWKKIKNWD